MERGEGFLSAAFIRSPSPLGSRHHSNRRWCSCMNPKAITIAESRLRSASRAYAELCAAEDFETFADHWTSFLVAWKGVYTVIEQGAKVSPQSRQWFAVKKAERIADPLLQYLFEARNDEEHGLAQTVKESGSADRTHEMLRDVPELHVRIGLPSGRIQLFGPDRNPAGYLQHLPPGPRLQTVNARGGRVYRPPMSHLGRQVDASPLGVAAAGLAYVDALVSEAATQCEP